MPEVVSEENENKIFITEDDEIIVFDDVKKTIFSGKGLEDLSNTKSPLHLAMDYFFTSSNFEDNKNITLKITKNLEYAI